jgi:hypothetical protein
MLRSFPWIISCVALTAACGGSGAEPATPDSEGESAAASDTSAVESPPAKAEPEPEPEPAKVEPKASALDTFVRSGTAYLLNFEKSDVGVAEKEKCAKKSKGDVAKEANCFSTVMNKTTREGFLFEQDEEEHWWYIRFGLVKNVRTDYNKVPVEAADSGSKKVTIKTTGADKAPRKKGKVPSEMVFDVIDEYTIEYQDADKGKMIYEPKLGLFNAE